ncbi:alpha/beta fold hydrolase [Nocardia rhamnosiphila]|uniref:alpha/beta fold hydrolase n=1 Tax=Nocardia rhamnosiphila TaxID=426716 RepID=UPI0033C2FFC6
MMTLGRFRSQKGRWAYAKAYQAALAAGPAPTSTHDVRTTFGTVRTYVWKGGDGNADPIVLLPGRSSGVPMWSANLAALHERIGRPILAMDAIGDAGMSEQTAPLTSMADQARWVDEALADLGCSRVHLLGHSFGGATAAAVALHAPHRLASLLLVEPVFTLRLPPPSTFLWALLFTVTPRAAWHDHALAAIGGVSVEEVRAATPIGEMIRTAAAQYRSSLPIPGLLSSAELAGIEIPTYIAIAGKSLAGGERAARRAEASIPRVEVDIWPGTTHSLPMQVPTRFADRLRAFIESQRHSGSGLQ